MVEPKNKRFKKEKSETLEVVCRIAPYKGPNPCVEPADDVHIRLIPPPGAQTNRRGEQTANTLYNFAQVFESMESQRAVFERCGLDLVENMINGINSLLFTYGVTGSGKTYTMTGKLDKDEGGIIPQAVDVLFNSIYNRMEKCVFKPNKYNGFTIQSEAEAESARASIPPLNFKSTDRIMESKKVFGYNREMACAVFVSYVEIYNDICYDLLDNSNVRQSKTIRTDAKGNNYVEGATEIEVSSTEEVLALHLKAQERRKVAATLLNATSSRSHSIFNIRLVMAPMSIGAFYPERNESQIVVSQLSLVDLAGSERTKRTENKGERLAEAGKINQSLSALRMCFDQLRENQRRGQQGGTVSYRDQRLTYLFKSFFEGHGKIRMIVCLNARPDDFEENVFVVNFAEKAQSVSVYETIAPAPLLADLAYANYSRRKVNAWYSQWEQEMSSFPNAPAYDLPKMPPIQLLGPNDMHSINRLREYFTNIQHLSKSQTNSTETTEDDFKKNLIERLCIADLDRARLSELEAENAELREYNSKTNHEKSCLQRELNALRTKLGQYESRFENERYREEQERLQREQYAKAIGSQRQIIKNVADILDESSPGVQTLRRKFNTNKRRDE